MESKSTSEPISRWEIAVLAFACVLPTIVTLAYFVWAAELPSGVQQAVYGGAKAIQFGLPAVWVLLVCRQWPRWRRPSGWGLAVGLGFGAAVAGLIGLLGTQWLPQLDVYAGLSSAAREKVSDLGINSTAAFVALGVFYALIHSLLEEYYWRWFVFGRMRRLISPLTAGVISSIAFAAHHVVLLHHYFGDAWQLTLLGSLSVAIGGGAWAWMYRRTGELWGAWLSHLLVDAALFAVGYAIVFSV